MAAPDNFIRFIDRLLAANCNFALWAEPNGNIPEIIIAPTNELVYAASLDNLNTHSGFVFSPHEISDKSPMILLSPGIYRKGMEAIEAIDFRDLPASEPRKPALSDTPYVISKGDYLRDIRQTVDEIQAARFDKVMVSRVIPHRRGNESAGEIYTHLLKHHTNAFVYLVNLPHSGTWMGATPETLLHSDGNTVETLSLAGTRPCTGNHRCRPWSAKEMEEHALVSQYIREILHHFNIHTYSAHGPETLQIGQVAHLKTRFSFQACELASTLGNFIDTLHPTPSVCGYPKAQAARFINQIEKHSRRYYTGYLGTWHLGGKVSLYVNLRCMELAPERYVLYCGGGITAGSVPDDEWNETISKAETLLSAINTVQNR